jgi:ATP-dependent DNA ligase
MRSLSYLHDLAEKHGLDTSGLTSALDYMDALRSALGTFDPEMQIDPMKARDLKNSIDWSLSGVERFKGESLTPVLTDYHVIEPKLDGVRVRLFLGAEENTLNSGRRSDVTFAYIERGHNFPHLRDAVASEFVGTILDAELLMPNPVFLDEKRGWTVGPLNSTMSVLTVNTPEALARQEKHGFAHLHVFDILALKGESYIDVPYIERRETLTRVLAAMGAPEHISLVPTLPATPESIQWALDEGYEGVMVKRRNGKYQPGKRGTEWLKIKKMSTGDFFIVGSNPGKGRNAGLVGSLKVAYMTEKGPKYTADVRGFDDATCFDLTDPATGEVHADYLGRVIEVMAQSRTKNDRLRHPHFVRWRPDKVASDCDISQLHLFAGEADG